LKDVNHASLDENALNVLAANHVNQDQSDHVYK
jgi:hypothetical protein